MILKLPINSNSWQASLVRWGAELRAKKVLGEEDFTFSNWSPELTSPMTLSDIVVRVARYIQIGKFVAFGVNIDFTTAAPANSSIFFTLPVRANETFFLGNAFGVWIQDGAPGPFAGSVRLLNSLTAQVKRYDSANWGLGVDRSLRCGGIYEAD